ncbi:MAG: hypothetical protein QG670_173 [Thermoproteota archaeon]|nr:hypothetical protein [Thermoproteota archaeon]
MIVYSMSYKDRSIHRVSVGYGTLEVLGPEHEFSVIDEDLKPLPIVDKIIKQLSGRINNNFSFSDFALGKELQKHVLELKAVIPFKSPIDFEEAMYKAILKVSDILESNDAFLLGLGMHPTLSLDEAQIWNHRDRQIYRAFDMIFNLRQHGWLNIQSFQINISYRNEADAVQLYNLIVGILPYLPAISAASPIYESRFGEYVDNRLHFYSTNQVAIPSIVGDIIPEQISSFEEYRNLTIRRYSRDLTQIHAPSFLIDKEWINSRGAIIRFDRKAIEIRVLDEQECIKSDAALSCFVRALLRGLIRSDDIASNVSSIPHSVLVKDFNSIIKNGLNAETENGFPTARDVCRYLFGIAFENASEEEKKYLPLVNNRIENGSLSEIVSKNVRHRAQKVDFEEAIISVYSKLAENLRMNKVYSG